ACRPSRSNNGRWLQPHAYPAPLVGRSPRVSLLYVLDRAVVPQGFSSLWLSVPSSLSSGIGDLWGEWHRKTRAAKPPQPPGEVHRTMRMARHTTGKLVVSPYRPQNSVWAVF